MDSSGRFIEVQGTAEGHPFSLDEMQALLALADAGIREIIAAQRTALAA
jgi:ribonuclease PH